ncbi:uncharacterized protein BO95DRAFT_377228, partial [Aspergillus brunneoviolaceus CBS 621.78]
FLDFSNFYRRFIKDFFKLTILFIYLIKKNILFDWSSVCQKIFKNLKNIFIKIFVL